MKFQRWPIVLLSVCMIVALLAPDTARAMGSVAPVVRSVESLDLFDESYPKLDDIDPVSSALLAGFWPALQNTSFDARVAETPRVASAGRLLLAPSVDADGDPASNPTADVPVPVIDLAGEVGGIVFMAAQLEPDDPEAIPIGVPVTLRVWNVEGVQFEQTVRSDAWGAAGVQVVLPDVATDYTYQATAPGYGETEARHFRFDPAQVSYSLHLDGAQLRYWQKEPGRMLFTLRSPVPLDAERDEVTLLIVRRPEEGLAAAEKSPIQPLLGMVDEAGMGLPFPPVIMRVVGTHRAAVELELPPGDYGFVASLAINAQPVEQFYSQPIHLEMTRGAPPSSEEATWVSPLEYQSGHTLVQYRSPAGQAIFDLVPTGQTPEISDDWEKESQFIKIWRTGPFEWQEERYKVSVDTIVDDGKKVASLVDFDYDPIARRYTLAVKSLQEQTITDTLRVDVLGPGEVVIQHEETQVVLEPGQVLRYNIEVPAELGRPEGLRVTLEDPLDFVQSFGATAKTLWGAAKKYGTASLSVKFYAQAMGITIVQYVLTAPTPSGGNKGWEWFPDGSSRWKLMSQVTQWLFKSGWDLDNLRFEFGGAGVNGAVDIGLKFEVDKGKCPDPDAIPQVEEALFDLATNINEHLSELNNKATNPDIVTPMLPVFWIIMIWGKGSAHLTGSAGSSGLTLNLTAKAQMDLSMRVGVGIPANWAGSVQSLQAIYILISGIQGIVGLVRLAANTEGWRVAQKDDCDPDPPDPRPPDDRQDVWQGIESFYTGETDDETIDNLNGLIERARKRGLWRAERLLTMQLREVELARFSLSTAEMDVYLDEADAIMEAAGVELQGILSGTIPITPSATMTEALIARVEQATADLDALPYAREQQQLLDAADVAERRYLELRGQELALQHELRQLLTADAVGVAASGFADGTLSALAEAGLPAQLVSLWPSGGEYRGKSAPYFAPNLAPRALIVPAGGLHAIAASLEAQEWLQAYVDGGGLLVVFTQALGEDWAALPGGEVAGVGYEEDQRCQHASVQAAAPSNWLVWMGLEKPDIQVDGAFTAWPEDALVLLTRTRGRYEGYPTMIEYPYGEGMVLATSAYGDWAWKAGFWWGDDWQMTRSILNRAYMLTQGQDVQHAFAADPNSSVTVSFPITNTSTFTTSSVHVVLPVRLNWGRNYGQDVTLSLPPGESGVVAATLSTPPVRRGVHSWTQVGLYRLRANVNTTDGKNYAVGGPFVYVRSPVIPVELAASLKAPSWATMFETVSVTATVNSYVDVTRTVTLQGLMDLPTDPIVLDVPPNGQAQHVYSVRMDGSKNPSVAYLDEGERQFARLAQVIRIAKPQIQATPIISPGLSDGDEIPFVVTNQRLYEWHRAKLLTGTLELTLTSPSGAPVWTANQTLPSLSPGETITPVFTLDLDEAEHGTYHLWYQIADGQGLFWPSRVALPSRVDLNMWFDHGGYRLYESYYYVREPLTLTVETRNVGFFDLAPQLEISAPIIGWSHSQSLTLPVEMYWSETYPLTLPGSLDAGQYKVDASLHLSNEQKWTEHFEVPGPQVNAQVDRGPYIAGQSVPITLTNTGGVDALVTYTLALRYYETFPIGQDLNGVIVPAQQSIVISGSVSEDLASGEYDVLLDAIARPGNLPVAWPPVDCPICQRPCDNTPQVDILGANVRVTAVEGGPPFVAGQPLSMTLTNVGNLNVWVTYTLDLMSEVSPTLYYPLAENLSGVPIAISDSLVITGVPPVHLPSRGDYYLILDGRYTPGDRPMGTHWGPTEISGADVWAQVTPGPYLAGSTIPVSLTNRGSVDATIVSHTLALHDPEVQLFLGQELSSTLIPAHTTVVVNGTVPTGTRSGGYVLHVTGIYTPGNRLIEHDRRYVAVSGPAISLTARTDRQLYLTADNITVTGRLTNTGTPLPQGDLELAIVREKLIGIGQAWQVYREENSGLSHNFVHAVEVDNQGNIWFGNSQCDDGCYDPTLDRLMLDLETWDSFDLPPELNWADYIRQIALDSQGQKWLATDDGVGMLSADNSNWTVYQSDNSGLIDDWVQGVALDSADDAWFGTASGANQLTLAGEWYTYTTSNSGLVDNWVSAVAVDGADNVWFGTDAGLNMLTPGGVWITYTASNSGMLVDRVEDIAFDREGNVWLATPHWSDGGISVLLAGGGWITYTTGNSGLVNGEPGSIAIDAEGRKWIGYDYEGISILSANNITWQQYTYPALSSNLVYDISPASNGDVWLATEYEWGEDSSGGVTRGYKVYQAWEVQNESNSGLSHNWVTAVEADEQYSVWFATRQCEEPSQEQLWCHSLTLDRFLLDLDSWQSISLHWDLGYMRVNQVARDSQSQTWVATDLGLGMLAADDSTWTIYHTYDSGLLDEEVSAVALDSANDVWIGTYGGVNELILPGEWYTYTTFNSGLAHNQVHAIVVDDADNVWFGTQGGLNMRSPSGDWMTYTTGNSGLLRNNVEDIAFDEAGNAWLATPGSGGGVSVLLAGGGWMTYTIGNSELISQDVAAITVDNMGRKWFGYLADGVSILSADNTTWQHQTYPEMSSEIVTDIDVAPNGDAWLATEPFGEIWDPIGGGATRVYEGWKLLDEVLWRREITASLGSPDTFQDVSSLLAGSLNALGRLTLRGIFTSTNTNQRLAKDRYPFYVFPTQVGLTLETDRDIYRPEQALVASGALINNSALTLYEQEITVTLNGATIYAAGPFDLAPGESYPYVVTTTAPLNTGPVVLEADSPLVNVNYIVYVAAPVGEASLLAPDVIGRSPFEVMTTVTNSGEIDAVVQIDIAGQKGEWMALSPGASGFMTRWMTTTADFVLTSTVRGDLEFDLSTPVAWGEDAALDLLPPDTNFAGPVRTTYVLYGTGAVTTPVQLYSDLDAIPVFSKSLTLWPGQTFTGTFPFECSVDQHTLTTSLFDQDGRLLDEDSEQLDLLPPGETLEPDLRLLNATLQPMPVIAGDIVSVTLEMANDGPPGPAVAGLQVFDPLQQWIITPAGWMTQSFTFPLNVPPDTPAGPYIGRASLNGQNRTFIVDVLGLDVDMALALDRPWYAPGDNISLTVTLTENASLSGDYNLSLSYPSAEDYVTVTVPADQVVQHVFNFTATESSRASVILANAPSDAGHRIIVIDSLPVAVVRPELGVYLTSDKALYHRGETIYLSATVMGTFNSLFVMGPMEQFLRSDNFMMWWPPSEEEGLGLVLTGTYPLSYTLPPQVCNDHHTFQIQAGGQTYAHSVDIEGWSVTSRRMILDKPRYAQQDEISAQVEFFNEGDVSIYDLRMVAWLFLPEDVDVLNLSPVVSRTVDLEPGLNVFTVTGAFTTPVVGPHRLLVNVGQGDCGGRVAGAAAQFDVGWAHLLELATDQGDYDPGEAGVGRLDVYGYGPTHLVVTATNGATLLDQMSDLRGFTNVTFTVPTTPTGDYLLVAQSTDQNGATDSLVQAYAVLGPLDQPPTITLTYPTTRTEIITPAPSTTITVTGRALDDSGQVTVVVNGQTVTPAVAGAFALPVDVYRGFNMISASAMDPSGNITYTPIVPVYVMPTFGLTLSADRTEMEIGERVTFQAILTAAGVLSDVVLVQTMPSETVTDVSAMADGGQITTGISLLDPTQYVVIWQGDLDETRPLTLTVGESAQMTGTLTQTVAAYWGWGFVDLEEKSVVITEPDDIHPDIEVSPLSFEALLTPGSTTTATLTISNVGEDDLDWILAEAPEASWLDESSTSGTLIPNDNTNVALTFDATGLSDATYTTTLVIDSNDPDEGLMNVIVTLTVASDVYPDIEVSPLSFEALLSPGGTTTATLTISNVGEANLDWILAEAPETPWLDESVTSGTLIPNGNTNVALAFDATGLSDVTYTTTLMISSNDPNEPLVQVNVTLWVDSSPGYCFIYLPIVLKEH